MHAEAQPEVSSPGPLRVLIIEDNQLDADLILRELRKGGFDPAGAVVETAGAFTREITANRPEIVLADYNLPQWTGLEALAILQREQLDIPLILVTGSLGDVKAVECIKRGATDYVLKDQLSRLAISVRRALQEKDQREQRKRAEQELASKVEELIRSNHDLEQFAYAASHDLQEPLRMVSAYTQLLGEKYRGKLDENADKYIGYASEGATRMQAMIQDLLAFSQIGRKGKVADNVDCNELMKEVRRNLSAAIRESAATIHCEELPLVWGKAPQLVQVFQNLIANAIKFRRAGPPEIWVRAEAAGTQWMLSVRDNGIGIAPEYAHVIFSIFQRLHTRAEYPGNGIGLAVTKKIVEHGGGNIWVESQPGRGSTFKFTLPSGAGRPASKEPAAHAASA